VIQGLSCKQAAKDKLINTYLKYKKYTDAFTNQNHRNEIIKEDTPPIVMFLEKVGKNEINHYYYLPEAAYKNSQNRSDGLIVDLQEIDSLSLSDASRIETDGIDALLLPSILDSEEQLRLKTHYWLDKPENFVMFESQIQSPWREHLMQRFSHAFIRIGLDGAEKKDYEVLATKVGGI